MTYQEAFEAYIFQLGQLLKVAPRDEHPGLKAALEMANAALADVDADAMNDKEGR